MRAIMVASKGLTVNKVIKAAYCTCICGSSRLFYICFCKELCPYFGSVKVFVETVEEYLDSGICPPVNGMVDSI